MSSKIDVERVRTAPKTTRETHRYKDIDENKVYTESESSIGGIMSMPLQITAQVINTSPLRKPDSIDKLHNNMTVNASGGLYKLQSDGCNMVRSSSKIVGIKMNLEQRVSKLRSNDCLFDNGSPLNYQHEGSGIASHNSQLRTLAQKTNRTSHLSVKNLLKPSSKLERRSFKPDIQRNQSKFNDYSKNS